MVNPVIVANKAEMRAMDPLGQGIWTNAYRLAVESLITCLVCGLHIDNTGIDTREDGKEIGWWIIKRQYHGLPINLDIVQLTPIGGIWTDSDVAFNRSLDVPARSRSTVREFHIGWKLKDDRLAILGKGNRLRDLWYQVSLLEVEYHRWWRQ